MNHLPGKSFCIEPRRETSVLSHIKQFPGRGFILSAREARQETSDLILLHVVRVRLPNGLGLKTPVYLMLSLFFYSNPQGPEHEYICQDWEKNKLPWCQAEKGHSHPVLTGAQLETFQMKDHWVLPGGKTASSTKFITLACEALWAWACAHTSACAHTHENKQTKTTHSCYRERLWKWILNTGISISTAHGGEKSLIKCGLHLLNST